MTQTRIGWDQYFLNIARAISVRMSCNRAQIGCVIVSSDHRILSGGYGGAPSGWPSCDEVGHQMTEMAHGDGTFDEQAMEKAIDIVLETGMGGVSIHTLKQVYLAGRDSKPSRQSCIRTVHAEENAVCTAARHGVALDGSTLYTTASTCYDCLKMVAQAGIVRIVYGEVYSGARTAGMDVIAIARERGIAMECLPMENPRSELERPSGASQQESGALIEPSSPAGGRLRPLLDEILIAVADVHLTSRVGEALNNFVTEFEKQGL